LIECRASSPENLRAVLASPFTGRIVIPKDADWDLKSALDQPSLVVHSNVQIVGERGDLGRRPILKASFQPDKDHTDQAYGLFDIQGSDVRIEGIDFYGPKDPKTYDRPREAYVGAIVVNENDEVVDETGRPSPQGRNVVIADNEFERWSGGAVETKGPHHDTVFPRDYQSSWKHRVFGDVGLVRVERNYFHHNIMNNGGYGVEVSGGSYVLVEGNVFDTNRHAVAADGKAFEGYWARYNYVLEGGYKQDGSYNQHFDVHGKGDGNDNYGGPAGTEFEISSNMVRGEQGYGLCIAGRCNKNRPVLMLRGRPAIGMRFHDNVLVSDDADDAVALKMSVHSTGLHENDRDFNFKGSGNHYDVDYSKEIAAGDFDGDGRSDVFVATGTAWFLSRAGIRPWELLHVSGRRTGELGFADMDGDRATDVVFRETNGRVGYLKSGTQGPVYLTSAPVEMSELRFGDFDGDGKTDMFYTRRKRWHIWSASDGRWHDGANSDTPLDQLLFGEFDEVKGTDVAAVKSQGWSFSSGGAGRYQRLNRDLGSFKNARVGDFDGNGKSDIVLANGRYSVDGRRPLSREFFPLSRNAIVGRFDGGQRDELVDWGGRGELVLDIDPGPAGQRARRSERAMR
jgi:hypothetical protein